MSTNSLATENREPDHPKKSGSSEKISARKRQTLNKVLVQGRALLALVLIIVVFSFMSEFFLDKSNLIIMSRHVAFNAIVAIGMLLVVLNGGIDLSVGSTVGLSGVMAGYMLQGVNLPWTDSVAYPPVWVVIIVSLFTGVLIGLVNGLVISKLRVAPFIATLGMLYVARGFALIITDGLTFTKLRGEESLGNTGFLTVMAAKPLGLPVSIWIMVAFGITFSIFLSRAPFGRWLYATGSNERAAELSGVPVDRVKIWVYVLSGFCAAAVGLLLTADLPAATPRGGDLYELNAIAAVVIGGAALSGGRGTVRGTLIGAFVIGFLTDGLVLVGVSIFWQQVIRGAVIILAVAIDQLQQRLDTRQTFDKVMKSETQRGDDDMSSTGVKELAGTASGQGSG